MRPGRPGGAHFGGSTVLPDFETLFDDDHIADWNTCDWFGVKQSR